jgi:hypothetical protein
MHCRSSYLVGSRPTLRVRLSGGLHARLALCAVFSGFLGHVWCPDWAASDVQHVQAG